MSTSVNLRPAPPLTAPAASLASPSQPRILGPPPQNSRLTRQNLGADKLRRMAAVSCRGEPAMTGSRGNKRRCGGWRRWWLVVRRRRRHHPGNHPPRPRLRQALAGRVAWRFGVVPVHPGVARAPSGGATRCSWPPAVPGLSAGVPCLRPFPSCRVLPVVVGSSARSGHAPYHGVRARTRRLPRPAVRQHGDIRRRGDPTAGPVASLGWRAPSAIGNGRAPLGTGRRRRLGTDHPYRRCCQAQPVRSRLP
jgi:hypothetical protein